MQNDQKILAKEPASSISIDFPQFIDDLKTIVSSFSEETIQKTLTTFPLILQSKIDPKIIITCCRWMLENSELILKRIETGYLAEQRGVKFEKTFTKLGINSHITVNNQGQLWVVLDPKGKNIDKSKDSDEKPAKEQRKVVGFGTSKLVEYGMFIAGTQFLPAAVSVVSGDKAKKIVTKERAISADIIHENKDIGIPGVIAETLAGDEYLGHGTQEGIPKKNGFSILEEIDLFSLSQTFAEKTLSLNFVDIFCIIYSMADGCRAVHHAGYLHRDLKLENFLSTFIILNQARIRMAKIFDFESSVSQRSSEVEIFNAGTTSCFPPEHPFFKEIHIIHRRALKEIAYFDRYVSTEKLRQEFRLKIFESHLFLSVYQGQNDRYVDWRTQVLDQKALAEEAKQFSHLLNPADYIEFRSKPVTKEEVSKRREKIVEPEYYQDLLIKFNQYAALGMDKKKYINWRIDATVKKLFSGVEAPPYEALKIIVTHPEPVTTATEFNTAFDLWGLYFDLSNLLKNYLSTHSLSPDQLFLLQKINQRVQVNKKQLYKRESAESFLKFLYTEVFMPTQASALPGWENIKLFLDNDPKIARFKQPEAKPSTHRLVRSTGYMGLGLLSHSPKQEAESDPATETFTL